MKRTILVVDDEQNMRSLMRMVLEDAGYAVLTATNGEEGLGHLNDPDLDVILSDLKMPGMGGEAFVARCQEERPEVPVVVVTAYGSIRSAVESIQAGAHDYLTKPFEPEELQLAVKNAVKLKDVLSENQQLHAAVSSASPYKRLVGESVAMQQLREEIARVAPYKTNVLITGESGTGKEAVARTIHEMGPRRDHPWVALNCSAIPRDLMESELFGYVKGAFTGATQNRMGRLEQAKGGTLFLDEIGDLDLTLQGKLLRVLQEREFSPVGSDSVRRADVRFIAATNRDLKVMVQQKRFRQDLLYRLDVYNITVPPLRERREDIPLLATSFVQELSAEMGKPAEGFTEAALVRLGRYHWPGNVRELRNTVERSLLTARNHWIGERDLPDTVLDAPQSAPGEPEADGQQELDLDTWLQEAERRRILRALDRCDGVQAQAAKVLGVSERSLWYRIKKLDIRIDKAAR